MKKVRWVSAAAGTALVAATLALPGAGVAYASGNGNITGNGNLSLLSGNTVNAPISAPVNLCGVSLAVLGFANSGCAGGATSNVSGVGDGSHNGNVTGNFNVPVGSGNTVNAPVSAPVNICSISGAVVGYANSQCEGGSTSCIGDQCGQPSCHDRDCTPCQGWDCHMPPPCQGWNCTPRRRATTATAPRARAGTATPRRRATAGTATPRRLAKATAPRRPARARRPAPAPVPPPR
jgi:ChpA-C